MQKQLQFTKINDIVVRPIPMKGGKPNKPVKGADLFSLLCNIFLCSRKKSGKTSLIYKIITETCTKNTTIIAFCSTIHKDASWRVIQEYCAAKKIPFIGHTSLYDDDDPKLDKLDAIVKYLKRELEDPQDKEPEDKTNTKMFDKAAVEQEGEEEVNPLAKRTSKSKWAVPEYLFIFDDISTEIKNSISVVSLLKDSRHIKAKVLISSQSWTDIPKSGRGQFDYFILFKMIPEEKLIDIYNENALSTVTLPEFLLMYSNATRERYNFLYIDKENEEYRKNFNKSIKLSNYEN